MENMNLVGPTEEVTGLFVRLYPVGTKAKGWGYEPNTRAAIEWLEQRVRPKITVCDIGTGTGILALVAARLGTIVTAYEIDDAVREIAVQNIKLNSLGVNLLGAYDRADGFDLVVANLGNIDYEGMGILEAGIEVWTSGETT